MNLARRLSLVVAFLSVSTAEAAAQVTATTSTGGTPPPSLIRTHGDEPRGTRQGLSAPDVNTRATHRFFDRTNVWLTGAEAAALLADGITTQHVLKLDPSGVCSGEADPLARPFVERGWPGQIVGGAMVMTLDAGLRYLFHRRSHHRLERWWPSIVIAYGATGAIHNAQFWNLQPCE